MKPRIQCVRTHSNPDSIASDDRRPGRSIRLSGYLAQCLESPRERQTRGSRWGQALRRCPRRERPRGRRAGVTAGRRRGFRRLTFNGPAVRRARLPDSGSTAGRPTRGTIRYAGQAPGGGGSMRSTMMDLPLTITSIMRYGTSVFGDGEVVTWTGDGTRRRSYAEAGRRAARLANALRGLGVDGDPRVGTFMWDNAEHLGAYLAIPSMGAVLHTLNIRLATNEVGYIATHAEDYAVIVDASLVPRFAEVLPQAPTVKHVIVTGGPLS